MLLQVDRKGEKGRGVMFAGNFAHRLQEAQLQRNRSLLISAAACNLFSAA